MLRNARDIKSKLSLLLQASSLIFNLKKKKEKKSSINQKKTDPSKRCNTHILYHTTKNISKIINNIQQPRSTLRCCKKEQH